MQNSIAYSTIEPMARLLAAVLIVITVLCGATVDTVFADAPLQSSNFRIDESIVGGGGLTNESSANYQASESIGDLINGNSQSTNFQLNGGYETTGDPALTFIVDTSGADFGSFSPASTAVATSTFRVIDYTSYGYAVLIFGNPPTNSSHTIAAMGTTDSSQAGVEQFGINLVANTSPVAFGANPDNGLFGVGTAGTNYAATNQYRYVSGETVAVGPKSSGLTIYTISYIVNVTSLTPGGQYNSNQTLICIGTY